MTTVTKQNIVCALEILGVTPGDVMIVHSSLKSFGYVEGGANAVIDACLDVLMPSGTLVFPTLIQKDFANAYETWHIDKPSDVGYITEVFRKRAGVVRSDQATHSVAAYGKLADFLTRDHGSFGKRLGPYGDTPFAESSPWQKLYDMGGKVLMIGVDMTYNTCRHLAEYSMVARLLGGVSDEAKRAKLKSKLKTHESLKNMELYNTLVWPYFDIKKLQASADERGMISRTICGDSVLMSFGIRETCDLIEQLLLENPSEWLSPPMCEWINDAKE